LDRVASRFYPPLASGLSRKQATLVRFRGRNGETLPLVRGSGSRPSIKGRTISHHRACKIRHKKCKFDHVPGWSARSRVLRVTDEMMSCKLLARNNLGYICVYSMEAVANTDMQRSGVCERQACHSCRETPDGTGADAEIRPPARRTSEGKPQTGRQPNLVPEGGKALQLNTLDFPVTASHQNSRICPNLAPRSNHLMSANKEYRFRKPQYFRVFDNNSCFRPYSLIGGS
jgi:hypothetical protein